MTDSLGQATLTDRAILAGSEALAGRRRGLRSLLPFAGPAVMASVAYMDPGNFATNIQAGAKYNYNLLWVVVVANVIAMIFQALSAKLAASPVATLPNCAVSSLRDQWSGQCGLSARSARWQPTSPSSSAAPSAFLCCWACRCSVAW